MSVVKINAITVPADSGDELAVRFARRAGSVDGFDGFEGFELFRPTDGRTTWLVVTRWRDEESFDKWVASREFGTAHGQGGSAGQGSSGSQGGSAGQGSSGSQGGSGASDAAKPAHGGGEKPVGMSSELWSYDIPDLEAMAGAQASASAS